MSVEALLNILPWVLPPFVGALIGYVTNALAIKMLFRPLTAKRFLGIRLPLTPGIIPRRRQELAESIGRMVSRELLTEDTVKSQLSSKDFQKRLKENIYSVITNLLNTPISSLQKRGREILVSSVEHFLAESLSGFFSSRSFIQAVRSIISTLVHSIYEKKLAELLNGFDIRSVLDERIFPLFANLDIRIKAAHTLENWFEEQSEKDIPLAEFIPEELIVTVSELISTVLPVLFDHFFRWLREKSMHLELETRGKRLLRDVLDKLNLLQKLIMSAAQYDRSLEEKMPAIVDEALKALEETAYDPDNLQKIGKVIEDSLLEWRAKGSSELFSSVNARISIRTLAEKLFQLLDSEEIRQKIAGGLEKLLSGQRRRTINEVLARYFGIREEDIVEFVSFQLLNYSTKKESSQALASEIVAFSIRFLEENRKNNPGNLLRIEEPARGKAAAFLADRLIAILDRRLPVLIRSFDIQGLVVARINGLDVADVEKLLLNVISRHLKWINLFGALLGALIGVSQIILALFR